MSGREPSEYVEHRTTEEVSFTEEGKATLIYKLLFNKEALTNFKQVYKDEYTKIYKLND